MNKHIRSAWLPRKQGRISRGSLNFLANSDALWRIRVNPTQPSGFSAVFPWTSILSLQWSDMLLLLLLYMRQWVAVTASIWGYPQCTEAICLGPLTIQNDCTTNATCSCQSLSFLSEFASCIGTLCHDDLAKAFLAQETNCKGSGIANLPLDIHGWLSAAHSPRSSLLAGYHSTPPAHTAIPYDVMNDSPQWTSCFRYMCIIPHKFYVLADPTDPINPLLGTPEACLVAENVEWHASCFGKFCPENVTFGYSRFQDDCAGAGTVPVLSIEEWVEASREDPRSVYSRLLLFMGSSSTSLTSVPTGSSYSSTTNSARITSGPSATDFRSWPSSSPSSPSSNRGRSKSDRIPLGVGLGIGIPAVLLALLGMWLWYMRARSTRAPASGLEPASVVAVGFKVHSWRRAGDAGFYLVDLTMISHNAQFCHCFLSYLVWNMITPPPGLLCAIHNMIGKPQKQFQSFKRDT